MIRALPEVHQFAWITFEIIEFAPVNIIKHGNAPTRVAYRLSRDIAMVLDLSPYRVKAVRRVALHPAGAACGLHK